MSWVWWGLGYVALVALLVVFWAWALRDRRRQGGN